MISLHFYFFMWVCFFFNPTLFFYIFATHINVLPFIWILYIWNWRIKFYTQIQPYIYTGKKKVYMEHKKKRQQRKLDLWLLTFILIFIATINHEFTSNFFYFFIFFYSNKILKYETQMEYKILIFYKQGEKVW